MDQQQGDATAEVDSTQDAGEPSEEGLEGILTAEALEEEKRLQKEREEQDKQRPVAPSLVSSTLEKSRFASLEYLLKQSEAYAQFLGEQMKDIEVKLTAEAYDRVATAEEQAASDGTEEAGHNAGSKRRRGQSKKPAKKAKMTLTPTQALLPEMRLELRDYQLKGVKWLISLYQNGVNGILADQMGLGKTAQTIGFLTHLRGQGVKGPFLVVAPLSTLPNWICEFERFAPSMQTILYHGDRPTREELRSKFEYSGPWPKTDMPVVVTSYEIIIADAKLLAKTRFSYLVVDEGHRLKNLEGRLIRELKTLPAENKLLLSGTPLQNNLSELWSLLNFLMPDVFKDVGDFEAWFSFSSLVRQQGGDQEILAAQQRNQVITKLHAILRPFMLRRLKSDVNIEVPRKQEIVLYAQMTEAQKKINQQLKDGTLQAEMTALAEQEGGNRGSLGKLNNMLMQLRKNCNHPDLITSPFTGHMTYPPPDVLIAQCGKMKLLDRLLQQLHERKHKVLIFSQMVSMLDIIGSYLEQQGHHPCRLDGSVSFTDRQASIRDFNNDENTWVFLLSTRAGGLGINLTAADSVIIYDSDWNPHQDMQAMDRCHRLGQTKPVLVFRLATAHSIEGKMLACAAGKMALERLVIQKGKFSDAPGMGEKEAPEAPSLSAAELMEMLQADYKMDNLPQSGEVDDKMLEKLLDRRHLLKPAKDGDAPPLPYPSSGVGYEVVQTKQTANTTVLQDINK